MASREDVERVVAILQANGALKAAEIAALMGLPATENSKRKVRAIARAARPGILSFPNSDGYKLSKDCTLEEINVCVSHWDSVIRDATWTKKLFLDLVYSRGGRGS